MSKLKTAGDLRGFLAETLIRIRDGSIDTNKANAIAKVAAQINQSLATEISTALQMEKMGVGSAVAGSMVIAHHDDPEPLPDAEPAPIPVQSARQGKNAELVLAPSPRGGPADKIWCDQCDMNVTVGQAVSCKSRHCKAKDAA